MTDQESPDQDRRKGTQSVVEQMLAERQEMLVLFSKLAGLEPYRRGKSSVEQLKQFCQILVDYIATAHFGIYERIAEGKERRQQVVDVAASMYPRVREMTDEAVRLMIVMKTSAARRCPRACMTICPLWARRSQHASNSRMSCW